LHSSFIKKTQGKENTRLMEKQGRGTKEENNEATPIVKLKTNK
jgi:hypothetical protein